jgi:hypothetical protein
VLRSRAAAAVECSHKNNRRTCAQAGHSQSEETFETHPRYVPSSICASKMLSQLETYLMFNREI